MKKTLKIIGIIFLISVILFIIGFITTAVLTFSGIGNPIINYKSKKEITAYVQENYPANDFDEIKVRYNFKFGIYGSHIVSKSSEDTHFYVSYDGSEIEDSFDNYVTSGQNTFNRIQQEFDQQVTLLLEENYVGQIELCNFDLYSTVSKEDCFDIISETVPLDGTLDIRKLYDLGVQPSLVVWFITEEEDITYENLANKFVEVKEFMEKQNIYVAEYSINLRLPEDHEDRFSRKMSVHNFPAELIESEDFIDKLIEFYEKGQEVKDK